MIDPTENSVDRIGQDHSHLGGGNPSGGASHHSFADDLRRDLESARRYAFEETLNVTTELNSLHLLVEQIRQAVWRLLRVRR